MKRISILMILILLLTLGCAPKDSIESGQPKISKAETPTELQAQEEPRNVSIPSVFIPSVEGAVENNEREEEKGAVQADVSPKSDLAESGGDKAEEPSSPHLYEDAVVDPPEKVITQEESFPPARVRIGLACLVGGLLVFHVGAKVEDALLRLNAVYWKLVPTMSQKAQLEVAERLHQGATKMVQKIGVKKQVAERLAARLIVTRSATGLAVKKGLSGFLGRAVGLAKRAAPLIAGLGVLQMVLEPTEVGGKGDELGLEDRFDFLKKSIEALEKDPHDLYVQDDVIKHTIVYLDEVIPMLEYESNQTYLTFEEFNAREDVSNQDKQSARKELEEFWTAQDSLIKYFKITSEVLHEIYYVEGSDRSKAEALLQEALPKLEAIFEKQKEKRERN